MSKTCGHCGREPLKHCYGGEMEYADGSSRACPNWNKKLDEIGGMTPEEADENARWQARFR